MLKQKDLYNAVSKGEVEVAIDVADVLARNGRFLDKMGDLRRNRDFVAFCHNKLQDMQLSWMHKGELGQETKCPICKGELKKKKRNKRTFLDPNERGIDVPVDHELNEEVVACKQCGFFFDPKEAVVTENILNTLIDRYYDQLRSLYFLEKLEK